MTPLFVYGTLRAGQGNHRCLSGAESLGPACTVARFGFVSLGAFPAAVHARLGLRRVAIRGELYLPTPEGFARVDRLEGHPTFYRRQLTEVRRADGSTLSAWIYILNDLPAYRNVTAIPSGDWLNR